MSSETESDPDRCDRCGGTGEIIRVEFGHEGLVPCPDCDTLPDIGVTDR